MMETPKKKKNDTIDNQSFWQNHYPLVLVIVTFIILTLYSIAVFYLSVRDMSNIVYPLIGLGNSFNPLALIISLIIALAVLGLIISRTVSNQRNIKKLLSDFMAFGLIIALAFLTYYVFVIFLLLGDKHAGKSRLQVNNSAVYTLVGRTSYPIESEVLTIYKCDSMGLFCSRIFETDRQYRSYYISELLFDEETREISIIVNGAVVETVQLE